MPRQRPQGAQVHTNTTKYVHNRNCKTNNLPDAVYDGMYSGMCKRCRAIMTWKKQYGKWKALSQNKICHTCKERTIVHPFANACRKCVTESGKCAHCHKLPEEDDHLGQYGASSAERRAAAIEAERDMGKMRERDRRRLLRQQKKGNDDSDYEDGDDDGKEAARKAAARASAAAAEAGAAASASESESEEEEEEDEDEVEEDNAAEEGASAEPAQPRSAEAVAIDAMFSHQFPTAALKFVEGPDGKITEAGKVEQAKTRKPAAKKADKVATEEPVIVVQPRANTAAEAMARAEAVAEENEEDSDEEL